MADRIRLQPRRVQLCAFLLGAMAILSACGGGSSGASSGPSIALQLPSGTADGVVPVSYTLTGSGTWDVVLQFSLTGGTTWFGAMPAPGCPTSKQRPAGTHTFLWDSVADGAVGAVLLRASTTGMSATASGTIGNAGLTYLDRSVSVDAAAPSGTYAPVHRGHYDLSPTVLGYLQDAGFVPAVQQVPVKSWRISVGRWEIGPVGLLAPESACYAADPAQLQACSREFYRGPNTLAGAQDPANYRFAYLDAAIAAVEACGAEPYLCFDYVPFTLASNQLPTTADNLYSSDANLSFSNGIRTSPPADPSVYAEVVKRTMMHVNGSFANGLNRAITHVEIGNEPDLLLDPTTPARYFWTGTQAQFLVMYQACAAALAAQFGFTIKIGAGSFAWPLFEGDPTFAQGFLAGLGATRLDFLSFHVYDDTPETVFVQRLVKIKLLRDIYQPAAELHCPEWGMTLDGGPEFDSMTAALHHAKALEYMALFDVKLAHRALIRDVVASVGGIGLLHAGPLRAKPAAHAFTAFERLYETPATLPVVADPPSKPMFLAGTSANMVTLLFFHEAPPTGQTGRLALTVTNLPFANYRVERFVLSDASFAVGDGLWLARTEDRAGAFLETVYFSSDVLTLWRLTQQ